MTYLDIVAGQFRKHRAAVWCVRGLFVLFLLATYAPAIALDVPFWTNLSTRTRVREAEEQRVSRLRAEATALRDDGETEAAAGLEAEAVRSGLPPVLPWFRSLFDPRVFPRVEDVFFNLLMATLPLLLIGLWVGKRLGRARVTAVWTFVHVALFVFVARSREELRTPAYDYQAAAYEYQADAFFPPVRHHPAAQRTEFSLTTPLSEGALRPGAEAPPDELYPYYVLGSDNLGNDVFSRLLYGTRIALTIGILSVAIYVTVGIFLGALAGYFGGWVDDLLMFFAQAVMTIPALFLILFLVSVIEKPTIYDIMLVIAAIGWPMVMRLVRAEFFRQREIDYVMAAKSLGLTPMRIMFRHIVPNSLAPVFVSATFGVAIAILLESSLSFLGLGDQSAPSWGQILNIGYQTRPAGPHLIWFSGLAIFFTVLVLNLIGEALRDALDPKLRK